MPRTVSFAKRIEEHPIASIAGVVVAVGTIVATVMGFLWNKQIDLANKEKEISLQEQRLKFTEDISALEGQVRAIERRLGGQTHFDIASLLKESDSPEPALKVQYYDDGNYYAIVDPTKWTVKKYMRLSFTRKSWLGQRSKFITTEG